MEIATLGGGCFWCLEAVYKHIEGISKVESGYSGGYVENPTYEQVCRGDTGHAEVIQIEYDSNQIDYHKILEIFWKIHDPTTLNRQGADVGPQYRSIILYHDEKQKEIALQSKELAQKYFINPIVTEIIPFKKFYKAEEYHQNFYFKNPNHPYCIFNIKPKIQKISKELKFIN
ncbi:MAG: peptide-methionine (S)-S-oxide reductase MsrA [Leptonema sp. (in: bacteria)]